MGNTMVSYVLSGTPPSPRISDAIVERADFCLSCHEVQRYSVLEVIGTGSYGTVCSAIDNHTGERVAIKRIQNVFDTNADAARVLRELKLLRLLKHPDIVDIKHILLPKDSSAFSEILVVMELMDADLHTVIQAANSKLSPDHKKLIMYQLLRGLSMMHSSGVVHRDLKPRNILINSNCKVKICDLGLARPIQEDVSSLINWTDYVATRWYRAPELCGCFYACYTTKVDIWAAGCIFAEILSGQPLFPGKDVSSQLELITDLCGKPPQHVINSITNPKARSFLNSMPTKSEGNWASHVPNVDPYALDLLKWMLTFSPSERPTAAQCLSHPYFANIARNTSLSAAHIPEAEFAFDGEPLSEDMLRAHLYQEIAMYSPHLCKAAPCLNTMMQHHMPLQPVRTHSAVPYAPSPLSHATPIIQALHTAMPSSPALTQARTASQQFAAHPPHRPIAPTPQHAVDDVTCSMQSAINSAMHTMASKGFLQSAKTASPVIAAPQVQCNMWAREKTLRDRKVGATACVDHAPGAGKVADAPMSAGTPNSVRSAYDNGGAWTADPKQAKKTTLGCTLMPSMPRVVSF